MIWALDSSSLSLILSLSGIGVCFPTILDAITAEIRVTSLVRSAGYDVDVMLAAFQSEKEYKFIDTKGEGGCETGSDFLWGGKYFGFDVHPFETLFFKSHRGIQDVQLERLTLWQGRSGYSSEEACGRT